MFRSSNANNIPPSADLALRYMLIVLAVVVGIVVYAYGWNVTDINVEETQDPVRQASVSRAMRELLSPNIFSQDGEVETAMTRFQIGKCDDAQSLEMPPREDDAPYVTFSAPCGEPGTAITVEGFGFHPNATGQVRLVRISGQRQPFKVAIASTEAVDETFETGDAEDASSASEISIFDIDSSGYFSVDLIVPKARTTGGVQDVEVMGRWPIGAPRFSETTDIVLNKIIETLFLALMATTLAVPIAVALSFMAARNLMRQIRLALGNVLVGLILLPVGWVLGDVLLGSIGLLGVKWGKDPSAVFAGAAVIVIYSLIVNAVGGIRFKGIAERLRDFVMSVFLFGVVVFTLGLLGGLGIWLSTQPSDAAIVGIKPLKYLFNLVGTLGTLVELSITLVAALGGAFLLSSLGMKLTTDALRRLDTTLSHAAGAILGMLGGAILLAMTASIGTLLALIGLLTPLAAAVLGGEIVSAAFRRVFNRFSRDDNDTQQMGLVFRGIVYAAGAVAMFVFTYIALDMNRAIIDGRLPSALTWDVLGFSVQAYIAKAALIGAALGAVGGGLVGAQALFPLGMVAYNTSRTVLNAIRSIEPLIMGIVFVIWVGIGPFAGVLALTLHSVAALGKLYSEQIESIDNGPIEAIQATGANRLQMIIYAVVPQIVPPYIAFTMYRWDINVRMSTIIGFVGGGGIGFLLQQQINLLRYREAGVAVLAIAIVVSVLDYASATIRERMV